MRRQSRANRKEPAIYRGHYYQDYVTRCDCWWPAVRIIYGQRHQ